MIADTDTPSGRVAPATPAEARTARGGSDPNRRRVLAGATGLAAGLWTARAGAQPSGAAPALAAPAFAPSAQAGLGPGQSFDAGLVVDAARALARRPFQPPPADLPEGLGNLSFEQYVSVRAKPDALLFGNERRGFEIEPLPRGFVFRAPVTVNVVEDGVVRRVPSDRTRFDFGRGVQPGANAGEIGLSGVRVFGDGEGTRLREVAIFQGASFFRSSARGQNLGVMARTLSVRTADPRGEELPQFRAFWIERPSARDNRLVLHALVESESCAAACRFALRAGETTLVDVDVTVVARSQLDNYGVGGMAATYLFGANDRRRADDVRPAVHEVEGLAMTTGAGEHLWRPVTNPELLQISGFMDTDPRGFGFAQRRRDLDTFQDDDQRFERRPTLWVEPVGSWGQGVVQLVEIPTDSEVNDNVVAFWRPRAPLAAGAERQFAYRQSWVWTLPDRPAALAFVSQTRVGRVPGTRRRRFLVDFAGASLREAGRLSEITPAASASTGQVVNLRTWPYPERDVYRVGFEIEPGNEPISELRLALQAGGRPVSEIWLYRWLA